MLVKIELRPLEVVAELAGSKMGQDLDEVLACDTMIGVSTGFSETIRAERKRLNMSLSLFASHLGASVASVKRWEAGTSLPSCAHREVILDLLQMGSVVEWETWRCHPGWLLRVARDVLGISLRKASEITSTSSSSWQRFENGESPLETNQAKSLAKQLGCFEWKSEYSLSDVLFSLRTCGELSISSPGRGCIVVVVALLHLERFKAELSPSEFDHFCLLGHTFLGGGLMDIGDHDLAGKSHAAVVRMMRRGKEPEPHFLEHRLGSVWRGFPFIKQPQHALKRLEFCDRLILSVPESDRIIFAPLRAILSDWAGRRDLSIQILESARGDSNQEFADLIEIIRAWFVSKNGNPARAVKTAEPYLQSQNTKLKFLANKLMFDASLRANEKPSAYAYLAELRNIRSSHGLWAPDLNVRSRQFLFETDRI